MMKKPAETLDDQRSVSRSDGQLKVLVSDGGEISKTLFWVFSPVSWVI